MKIVLVGHGMVGHKFLEALRQLQVAAADVTVLCEEPRTAYGRVHLSDFFAGKMAEDLSLVEPGFFADTGFALRLNSRAVAIDRRAKTVTTQDGVILPYDKLVLATGSYPFVPPVKGSDREQCFVYRTIEDLEAMKAASAISRKGVVVGGGLLGLECAKALRDLGLETHVVEFAPRLMAVQIDDEGGRILRSKIEALDVQVHTGRNTAEITDGRQARHRMVFADGSHLETDMIVFSAGIRPRDELARQNALAVGARGGIAIDDHCRTSDPDIYAIGECAAWRDQTFGLVAPGYEMARIAARRLAGEAEAAFAGADMSTKLKLMGVDVASIGDAHGRTSGCRSFRYADECKQVYKKIVVSADGRRLLGAVLVGNADEYGTLLQTALNGIALPDDPEFLILPAGDGKARPGLGAHELPDSAQICSCNNVSKGQICAAVAEGATSIGEIKACTHAYGKSLRTVKSCVGSTWCRYGVQDSVGLAIELENRYKGLRAPHKIKFGVSGCTRECAEAQGKDVGIIATERGWNLYVCGNGGMKPRHAELIASDLDKAALVRLIDRFLMFYVCTADRLQRTSTWRDKLEGGLDYLKAVILDDSLGLAAELERQMQHVVDTYQCEWKTAVTDPGVRRRFRSFVNDPQPDACIVFVEERGQIRPARADEREPMPELTA